MKKLLPIFIMALIIFSVIIFAFRFPQKEGFLKLHPVKFDEKDFVELKTTSFLRDIRNRNIKAISGYILSTKTDRTIIEFNRRLNAGKDGEKTIPFDNISLVKIEVEIKRNKAYVFFEKRGKQKQNEERKPDIIFLKKGKSWKIISFPNLLKKQDIKNIDRKEVIKK